MTIFDKTSFLKCNKAKKECNPNNPLFLLNVHVMELISFEDRTIIKQNIC